MKRIKFRSSSRELVEKQCVGTLKLKKIHVCYLSFKVHETRILHVLISSHKNDGIFRYINFCVGLLKYWTFSFLMPNKKGWSSLGNKKKKLSFHFKLNHFERKKSREKNASTPTSHPSELAPGGASFTNKPLIRHSAHIEIYWVSTTINKYGTAELIYIFNENLSSPERKSSPLWTKWSTIIHWYSKVPR